MKAVLAILLFALLGYNLVSGQTKIDSLWGVWQNENLPDTTRLSALQTLTWEGFLFNQPDSAFSLAQRQLDFASNIDNKQFIALAQKTQGASLYFRGDYLESLERYRSSLETFQSISDKKGITACLNNIANIFVDQGNYPKAIDYYTKSLKIRETIGDTNGIASSLVNIAVVYLETRHHQKSLQYFKRAQSLFQGLSDNRHVANCLIDMAQIHLSLNQFDSALSKSFQVLDILKKIDDNITKTHALSTIGEVYFNQGEIDEALKYYNASLSLSEKVGYREITEATLVNVGNIYNTKGLYQQAITTCAKARILSMETGKILDNSNACKCLFNAYKAVGNSMLALTYHEQMLQLNDSLHVRETENTLQQMEFNKQLITDSLAEVEKGRQIQLNHEKEVQQKNRINTIAIASGSFLLVLAGALYSRVQYIRKSKSIIEKERDRSDNLLLNILPQEIAQELKEKGKAEARDFNNVSILFSDFKEFTSISENFSAQELVAELNICFQAFDTIIEKYGIEKIKTIGDAYMAAGGLPIPSTNSTKNTILAGLEMQEFMKQHKSEKESLNQISFEMRVGIHTGPIVAGIVGVKKFQYDIWGDAVNTANRIETNGKANKVNISQTTFEIVKDDIDLAFEGRGKIQAKGKGEIEMYFVSKKQDRNT